jgi:hypothetical protein
MTELSKLPQSPSNASTLNEIFAVPQADVAQEYPSSQAAVDLLLRSSDESMKRREGARYAPGTTLDPEAEQVAPAESKVTRKDLRQFKGPVSSYMGDMMYSGAQYAATFPDEETGKAALKTAITQDMLELPDELFPFQRIVDESKFVKEFRALSSQAVTEVEATTANGPTANYHLLRILATDVGTEIRDRTRDAPYRDWRPNHLLARLTILGDLGTQQSLTAQTRQGEFDTYIAADLLRAASTPEQEHPDVTRIRKLSEFAMAVADLPPGDEALAARMASSVDQWPVGERQIVLGVREMLIGGMATNFTLAGQRLKENYFTWEGDLLAEFRKNADFFFKDMLRRIQLNTLSPQGRARMTVLRAQTGRKRPTKQRKEKPEADAAQDEEVLREPPKLVTCNLDDGTTIDGIDEVVAGFIEETSQGGSTVKQDLERSLEFFVRIDLPPTQRRGTHKMVDTGVRFNDKILPLWEYKPFDAAGLSLRTDVVKGMRLYYIKLPDNTYGVIAMQPRAQQEEFLKKVRVKIKRGKQEWA